MADLTRFASELRARIVTATDTRLYCTEQVIRLFLGGLAMSQLHIMNCRAPELPGSLYDSIPRGAPVDRNLQPTNLLPHDPH